MEDKLKANKILVLPYEVGSNYVPRFKSSNFIPKKKFNFEQCRPAQIGHWFLWQRFSLMDGSTMLIKIKIVKKEIWMF